MHETELLKTKLEQTSHHQQMEEVNNLLKNIGRLWTFTKAITKISNIHSIRLLKISCLLFSADLDLKIFIYWNKFPIKHILVIESEACLLLLCMIKISTVENSFAFIFYCNTKSVETRDSKRYLPFWCWNLFAW